MGPTTEQMEKFGQTDEEIALLLKHDENEELHAYVAENPDVAACHSEPYGLCVECGGTEDDLMHNNTWRNVEPLMQG